MSSEEGTTLVRIVGGAGLGVRALALGLILFLVGLAASAAPSYAFFSSAVTCEAAEVSTVHGRYTSVQLNCVTTDPQANSVDYTPINQPANAQFFDLTGSGEIQWTPPADFAGQDSMSYLAIDDQGNSSGEMTVPMRSTNIAPDCGSGPNLGAVTQGATATGSVSCTDGDDDLLSYSVSDPPAKGTASVDQSGNITYTAGNSGSGSDSFAITVSDGVPQHQRVLTATVDVAPAAPANTVPTCQANGANPEAVTTGQAKELRSLCADADGDALTHEITAQPAHGSVAIKDGKLVYTAQEGYSGSDSFTFRVSDGRGGVSDVAVYHLSVVKPPNRAPVCKQPDLRVIDTSGGVPSVYDVTPSCNDPDGDAISIQNNDPWDRRISVRDGRWLAKTPDPDSSDFFYFSVSDGQTRVLAAVLLSLSKPPESAVNFFMEWVARTAPRPFDPTQEKIYLGSIKADASTSGSKLTLAVVAEKPPRANKGTASARKTRGKRVKIYAKRTFKLKAGRTTDLSVRVTKSGRKALRKAARRSGKLRTVLMAKYTSNGKTVRFTEPLTLQVTR